MFRRSLGALLLLVIVVVAVYVWMERSGSVRFPWRTSEPSAEVRDDVRELGQEAREGARELGQEAREGARAFGAEARETLTEAGRELRDAKVSASVKTALGLNRTLRQHSIDVSTENGVVTLSGRVGSEEERARAESVAAAVPDVRQVVNRIRVGGVPASSTGRSLGERFDDEKIEVAVRLALSLNKGLDGTDVTVQAYRGEVTLAGEVATEAQRQQALQIARDTSSVSRVVDAMHVRASAAAGVAAAAGSVAASGGVAPGGGIVPGGASPSERAAAAQRALRANPHLAPFNLEVQQEGDRLVVRGAVSTAIQKDLAVALAREAAGEAVQDAVEVRAGV
jgi:osmotically-inducible protein OsmY